MRKRKHNYNIIHCRYYWNFQSEKLFFKSRLWYEFLIFGSRRGTNNNLHMKHMRTDNLSEINNIGYKIQYITSSRRDFSRKDENLQYFNREESSFWNPPCFILFIVTLKSSAKWRKKNLNQPIFQESSLKWPCRTVHFCIEIFIKYLNGLRRTRIFDIFI